MTAQRGEVAAVWAVPVVAQPQLQQQQQPSNQGLLHQLLSPGQPPAADAPVFYDRDGAPDLGLTAQLQPADLTAQLIGAGGFDEDFDVGEWAVRSLDSLSLPSMEDPGGFGFTDIGGEGGKGGREGGGRIYSYP